jgi:hypothetical protein
VIAIEMQEVTAIARTKRAVPSSARLTRAGFGVAPKRTFPESSLAVSAENAQEKSAMAKTPSPASETDALPGIRGCAQIDGVALVCNDGNLL